MDITQFKRAQLEKVSGIRQGLWKTPDLCWLFFELTTRCNLHCRHCGSQCRRAGLDMEPELVTKVLREVDPRRVMIAVTGGEPMLHPRFYEMMTEVTRLGFRWGMTSNATLIDDAAARRLKEAGMRTISVSLDGLESSHDALRGHKGAWREALSGTRALIKAGFEPQITTVVHPGNLGELPELEKLIKQEGIRSWRIINVDPIGRARTDPKLLLDSEQFRSMIAFIRDRRFNSSFEVTYGCSHFLGVRAERMVRNQYFFCGAGITVASIRVNGDICSCLDIENRPELVQGNAHTDSFMDVWLNRFRPFRADRTEKSDKCRDCPDRVICGGDSFHTWDFDNDEPLLCGKEYMEPADHVHE